MPAMLLLPTIMPTKLYNPPDIAAAFVSSEKLSLDARQAGAQATLHHGVYLSDPFSTRTKGGLHLLYMNLHGRGGQMKIELQEINTLISNSLLDTFDAVRLASTTVSPFLMTCKDYSAGWHRWWDFSFFALPRLQNHAKYYG